MTEISKHPLDIPYYSRTIASSSEYLEARNDRLSTPEAICRAAGALALKAVGEGDYRSREGDTFAVISRIDSFATNQAKLDQLVLEKATGKEKRPYKKELILFNHAVKEMVNNNPALKFDEVTSFITNMYINTHQQKIKSHHEIMSKLPPEERTNHLGWFQNALRASLSGMRYELGTEQILGCIEGLDYKEASADDDAGGIDYFITLDGKTVGVDIKGNKRRAATARLSSQHPERIIWSQLTSTDFGDNFRVTRAVARSKALALKAELSTALLVA